MAAEAAKQDQSLAAAFELSYKAGLILQQQKRLVDAAEQFQDLSLDYRQDARAADAHLAAVWNMYQAARQDPNLSDRYALMLDEQISVWPQATSTHQARMWLGSLLALRRQWKEAAATYMDVAETSEHFAKAIQQAGNCWDAYFEAEARSSSINTQEVQEALQALAALFPDNAEGWTDASRNAALAAARLRLRFTKDGYAEARTWLENGLASNAGSEAWRSQARALLVTALAGLGGRATGRPANPRCSAGRCGRNPEDGGKSGFNCFDQ